MLQKVIGAIIGDQNKKAIKKIMPLVEKINKLEVEYTETLTKDEDFPAKTEEFRKRLADGETEDDLLVESFALVKAACRRLMGKKWMMRKDEITWDMIPYDVQIVGGVVLHQGNITEMKTGEGKTLVCTMPAYLNAISGDGVYVVTVNDYLAHRDAEWMGGLFNFLGLKVGVIAHGQGPEDKKAAYDADITYGTNNEFGFDYLRDNMSTNIKNVVQPKLNFAIVDEVDSILIDEARTPLIISAPAEDSTSKYIKYMQLVKSLEENEDFNIDEKARAASLTEQGIKKMEQLLGVENIYTEAGFLEVHHIEQALKATAIFKKDTDYVVNEGEVVIVDEFTGRLMPGRRYSEGLHQAIEAKEGVQIKKESQTLANITFQNYFRLFKKLSGMTGTAATEVEEFLKIYGLDVIEIPTHKPVIRDDKTDAIYKSQKAKYMAIANKAKELHEKGQPLLIGTVSIEKSEVLSKLLKMQGVPHNVLNAKFHEKEAEIVKGAGQKNTITIATNMAGRGTDIKLGEGVKELGGLYVISSERHEARRIDNQLRGRAGRQGDPGASQFYVSMEDELMRIFGGAKVQGIMNFLKIPEDMPIENKTISKSIESAQKKVEGRNFDVRKHLVEYDDILNHHRGIIYSRRRNILETDNIKNEVILAIEKEMEGLALMHSTEKDPKNWNFKEIVETVRAIHRDPSHPLNESDINEYTTQEELIDYLRKYMFAEYDERENKFDDKKLLRELERSVYLHIIDTLWMAHIDKLRKIRESVSLQGYGQRDPLIEYKNEAFRAFDTLLIDIQSNTINTLFKIDVDKLVPKQFLRVDAPTQMQTNEAEINTVLSGDKKGNSALNAMRSAEAQRAQGGETKSYNTFGGGQPAVAGASATPMKKVGRNEPCPCGSGKKFKKCHGKPQ